MKHLQEKIRQLSTDHHAQIVAIRRHIHAHAELSFQEHKRNAAKYRRMLRLASK